MGFENNNESLFKYIRFGSLPYLRNLPVDESVIYEYLRSVYHTILYKDIISRFSVRNTALLENLLLFLMDNIGSIFSAKRISDFLKSQKYYFEDLGIRHAIWGYKLDSMGKILENLVYKHLQRNKYEIFIGSIGEYEIDFVGRKGPDIPAPCSCER